MVQLAAGSEQEETRAGRSLCSDLTDGHLAWLSGGRLVWNRCFLALKKVNVAYSAMAHPPSSCFWFSPPDRLNRRQCLWVETAEGFVYAATLWTIKVRPLHCLRCTHRDQISHSLCQPYSTYSFFGTILNWGTARIKKKKTQQQWVSNKIFLVLWLSWLVLLAYFASANHNGQF